MAHGLCCSSFFAGGTAAKRRRTALHAGSWYPEDPGELREGLQGFLAHAPKASRVPKAVIAPHAGLRYCGRTAAHAYANLDHRLVRRVVILGPSHHKRLVSCALPAVGVTAYETPLGPAHLDLDALEELRSTGDFDELSVSEDEREHSVEMQLPFTQFMLACADSWSLLPLVVGHLAPEDCEIFAEHLAPFFDDPATLFVVSSDFCHWGAKFKYQPLVDPSPCSAAEQVPGMLGRTPAAASQPVNAGIEALDKRAMGFICRQDVEGFRRYLEAERNTICGRNPIILLLELLRRRPGRFRMRFLHYSQSRLLGKDPAPKDSSVSYAAAVLEPIA